MSAGGARRGRRDNGLYAAEYAAAGDVDPRVGEHLLDVLAAGGIAAYLLPASDLNPITRNTTIPPRPTDRLYVDRAHLSTARDYLARLAADERRAAGNTADIEAEWARIVAGFYTEVDPTERPWPEAENLGEPGETPTARGDGGSGDDRPGGGGRGAHPAGVDRPVPDGTGGLLGPPNGLLGPPGGAHGGPHEGTEPDNRRGGPAGPDLPERPERPERPDLPERPDGPDRRPGRRTERDAGRGGADRGAMDRPDDTLQSGPGESAAWLSRWGNRPRSTPPDEPSLLDSLDTFGAGLPDDSDEEGYTPPAPPPLPRFSKYTVAGVIAIFGGFVLFVFPHLMPLDPDVVMLFGFTGILAGFVTLVWRLRPGDEEDEDDNPDNGAVV